MTMSMSLLLYMIFLAQSGFLSSCAPRPCPLSLYPYSAHYRAERERARLSNLDEDYTPPLSPVFSQSNVVWNVSYFQQRVDHFSFTAESEETFFQQKYILSDKEWSGPEKGGPIFVYCGNEGPIQWFLDNAGWITEIAAEFGALVVGPEHRYYGDSNPFGSAEAAYKDVASRAFLTTEQALADMAILLTSLQKNLSAEHCPIVVFGGSYGGMMASWFRLKYPHVTVGAIASSAPILQYDNVVPKDVFYRIVSRDYKIESESCFTGIRSAWQEIRKVGGGTNGLKKLGEMFSLCQSPSSSDDVINWVADGLVNLAMVDYPVPAEFLAPLPAYPIREVCRRFDSLPSGSDVVDRLVAGIAVYLNYSGTGGECYDIDADPHGEDGWNFQACTEHVMPFTSNASNSMFEPFQWNQTAFNEGCKEAFGIYPRPSWILTEFGGRNIKEVLRLFGSNIVFSNGALDPWSGGGVTETISDTIVSLVIPDGAHHLDLRASTPADPPSVIWQREEEKKHIYKWLKEHWTKQGQKVGMATRSHSFGCSMVIFLVPGTVALLSSISFAAASFFGTMKSSSGLHKPLLP